MTYSGTFGPWSCASWLLRPLLVMGTRGGRESKVVGCGWSGESSVYVCADTEAACDEAEAYMCI